MRLKELRDKSGMTQKEVAKKIGCTVQTYARYERGDREPDIDTLKRLADYFYVSVDYLIGHDTVKTAEV